MVGLSHKPDRPSYRVAKYLQDHGYRIVPVNPALTEVLGERSYPDLASIPGPVDVVDIFRRPEDVPPIVEAAIAKGAKVVWMQEGIVNEAGRRAGAGRRAAGGDEPLHEEGAREESGGPLPSPGPFPPL